MGNLSRQGSAMLSNFLAMVVPAGDNLAESEFTGTWRVEDSNGQEFDIALLPSGTAEATRAGEGMSGTWAEEDRSAVITWDTGWTTKITRTGDAYVKTAYDETATTPTNTSVAERID
ncbi:MAG TPA: hypothetical protein PK857_11055 [Hyphomicrobium sp.]|nr:hypothetical protein [Hyphomicrobium sp.]